MVLEITMSEIADVNSVADVAVDESLLMVAFASSDGESVNQHFGSSQGFHVFGVRGNEATLMAIKTFPKEKKDGNEDKLKPKLSWLHGCDLVYCGSVGGSATKQLVMLGAHPIVVKGGPEIEEIIEESCSKNSRGNCRQCWSALYARRQEKVKIVLMTWKTKVGTDRTQSQC